MALDTASLRSRAVESIPSPSLHEGGLFAGCPELVGSPFAYARDEEIYGEGEEAEFVYRVTSGAVRTYKILGDGRRQITGFHLPGDLFGFEPGEVHTHTAEAISETKVLMVRRRQVARAAATRAEVACQLWSVAASGLRHAQDHMLLLGRRSAVERVAAFLMDVDDRLGATGTFDLPMTRRDIADYLGLTLETVSRTVTQLESDGALLRAGGRRVSLRRGRMRRAIEA
ncbi:cyclic nucleotide-binding domain-containing protein [Methylobacterium isbiliense]|jgi:CRP-like cAMP-binding protein|uniref:Nitrogen fixation regulation protein FixK n=1 Tax=Methylobacterium isbiliense TaxID=315478 RepID=A0ABQ4SLV0_9HYPH|nr:cyclic nucleotide-binding domain-containing protein [Methylobacterium isbiliense]MDN3625936.1 cyclic nucleotide-binding domain-containing protein [Methylobacterium isbiliense]GJE04202.1 Nitrogen fixation regulation protein FixK [Methylobacterium isbiliense]